MGHPRDVDPKRSDVERPLGQWLDVERDSAETRVDVKGVEPVGQPGRTGDPDPRRPSLIAKVMAQRHEVDEVIGVEVADDDRIDGRRIDQPGQPRERALAEVEQKARAIGSQKIGGASGPRSIGIRRTGPDHAQ